MASVDYTAAQGFRAYMEDFSDELLYKLFLKSVTRSLITAHEGVKGRKVLTEMTLGTLVQKWQSSFDASPDVIDFKPRAIDVEEVKVDLRIFPQKFEQTYLAFARRPGFANKQIPFEGYIMERVTAKIAAEIERAIWQAEIPDSQDADAPLIECIDGFLHIIQDEIDAANLSPVTTGVADDTNTVSIVEDLHAQLGSAYEDEPLGVFVSPLDFKNYMKDYRERYGKHNMRNTTNDGMTDIPLDFANNTRLIKIPGMGGSRRIILTPLSNLHYAYDTADDMSNMEIEKDHRALDFMMDFKIGAQIGIVDSDLLVVNDQE